VPSWHVASLIGMVLARAWGWDHWTGVFTGVRACSVYIGVMSPLALSYGCAWDRCVLRQIGYTCSLFAQSGKVACPAETSSLFS